MAVNLRSEDNSTCYDCHNDPTITTERNGVTIPLTVKPFTLPRSVHGKLKCVDCHEGFDPYEIPHKEVIGKVNCIRCHQEPQLDHKFHPQMLGADGKGGSADVNCKGCHGTHEIISKKTPGSEFHFTKSTEFCGRCHPKIMQEHLVSEHFVELSHDNPNAPTCINCHSEPITKRHLLDKAQLKLNQEKLCLNCHLNHPDNPSKFAKTLIDYENSVHGQAILRGNANAAVCVDCHGAHRLEKADVPTSRINKQNIHNVCGSCHGDIGDEYMKSIHGQGVIKGFKDAPTCTYCHGEHNINSIPEVPEKVFSSSGMKFNTVVDNRMIYCIACHSDEHMMKKYNLTTIEESHKWMPSQAKHWETVRCVDCHASHEGMDLHHNILPRAETVKQCEECHSQNSRLMSQLYVHEKQQSRSKYGFINGTLLSDAYVIGTTRNIYLDTLSLIIFGLTFLGIGMHGFLRWKSKKNRKS
ncbi:MAG: cytochrome c3 family protein [Candidatus Kapaibacterium sp.]